MKTLEPTFFVYDKQLGRVADYIGTVTPGLITDRSAVPVFVESMTVIMVARFEHFLTSLVAGGVGNGSSWHVLTFTGAETMTNSEMHSRVT